jgi:hypothetical protein
MTLFEKMMMNDEGRRVIDLSRLVRDDSDPPAVTRINNKFKGVGFYLMTTGLKIAGLRRGERVESVEIYPMEMHSSVTLMDDPDLAEGYTEGSMFVMVDFGTFVGATLENRPRISQPLSGKKVEDMEFILPEWMITTAEEWLERKRQLASYAE